jgi:hypothetical protein
MSEARWFEGSCHCGQVRFRARTALADVVVCNCSVCRMKGFVHAIVPPADFELVAGEGELSLYQFGSRTARHTFCRHCGIHPFYVPRSDPDKIDVNVRCLEGVDSSTVDVGAFDGANWERAILTASWRK